MSHSKGGFSGGSVGRTCGGWLVLAILSSVIGACGKGGATAMPPIGPTGSCGQGVSAENCSGGARAPVAAMQAAAAIQKEVVSPAQTSQSELASSNGGANGKVNLLSAEGSGAAATAGGSLLAKPNPIVGNSSKLGSSSLQAGLGSKGANSGSSGSSSSGTGGGRSGGSGSSAGGLSENTVAASAGSGSDGKLPAAAAGADVAAGAYAAGGGGARGAHGAASGAGSDFGGDLTSGAAGGESSTHQFGATGEVNPQGSEDPNDYFTRLGIDDNIFKIVERRYRNQAVAWARVDQDSVVKKSNAH